MAYGLPDNLWIGLLVMAVIILAILWNDKVSKSNGRKRKKDDDEGPSVSMRKTGSTTVGEEFALRGSYDPGDGSISDYSLTMNGRDISGKVTSWSGGTFATDTIEVPDVDTVECDVQVSATYGTADDSISFNPSRPPEPDGPELEVEVDTQNADPGEDNGAVTVRARPTPGDNPIQETQVELPDFGVSDTSTGNSTASVRQTGIPPGDGYRYIARTTDGETTPVEKTGTFDIEGHPTGNLRVEASHEIVDPDTGEVRIWAEVVSSPVEVQGTTIKFRPVGAEDWRGDSSDGDRVQVTEEFSPGTYEYEGLAVDVNEDRDTDRGTFQIEGEGGGGGSRDDYPELVRIINQNTNNNLGDLGGFQGDEEIMGILEQILEQVDSSGSDGETARVGMDAYQLLFALNALGVDLDSSDNQQIVAELRQIRQQMGGGGMSSDELENALRTVLHDVFGQDLQSVIQGLDLGDGFDEDAIVQAIEDKDIDLSQVTNRLDNIEQAVTQIQSQGGDLGDVEQKLDDIESAVRDLQVDDQIFQDLTAEIRSLRNEGVQVNVDMNDPLIIKLVEDIQHSSNPQAERQRILQRIRQEGMITRRMLIQLLGDDSDDESGGTGNKNPQSDNDGMANEGTKVKKFDEQELKSLEEDINALSQFVDDFDQLDFQKARKLKDEIEKEVNNIQSELNDVHNQAELFTGLVDDINDWSQGGKNKQDIIDEIENSYQHENKIREELKDIHNKMSEIRRKVKKVEDLCTQFNEVLGVSENEFSSTVDSITDDMHRMDSLIEHVNDYLQGHREGQGDEYIPDEVLGEAPR